MISYGLFVVNSLVRAAVGVMLIGAAPMALAFFVRAATRIGEPPLMPRRVAAFSRPRSSWESVLRWLSSWRF